nr:M23 family metallopeptidase [Bacteroidota bacterium]
DVDELNKKIEEIVAEEMSQASENNGSGRENPNHSTPEEDIISKSFASNKGRLPWPSKSGVISSGYGEHKHPDLKWVRVRNNGINIVTPRGSKARAVFGGAVTRVLSVPNFNNVVIIRHGEYLSVYSNLDVVYVKTGDNIDIKSEIGTIHTNGTLESYELHFEIWKGKTLLNPEEWLAIPKPDGMTQTDAP